MVHSRFVFARVLSGAPRGRRFQSGCLGFSRASLLVARLIPVRLGSLVRAYVCPDSFEYVCVQSFSPWSHQGHLS